MEATLSNTVFHAGEQAVQRMAGEEQMAQANGRIIQPTIIKGAVSFIERQSMAIVSSQDGTGQPWVSVLVGQPGFIEVPALDTVHFHEALISSSQQDIFYENIAHNPAMGSLFIELATRKRYRINGKAQRSAGLLQVAIQEAYVNCPKYIQQQVITVGQQNAANPAVITQGELLGPQEQGWIAGADTLFVGSMGPNGRLDASHRGGKPGFVQVQGNTLKIPDYPGNGMYNTLGNLKANPAASLLFINFQKGETLQLTGKAELAFGQDSPESLALSGGTGRFWLFHTEAFIRTRNHHKVNWEFVDYSPFNP